MHINLYKRNQVEWAIWQVIVTNGNSGGKPPQAFRTRIKRLLDIDRSAPEDRPGFAFSNGPAGGQGVDVPFTAFDAFCLALGLELLDMGFKQAEVVFLLQHIRTQLRGEFDWILSHPIAPGNVHAPEDYPDLPTYKDGNRCLADYRVFTLIQKVELKELQPDAARARARARSADSPFIYKPAFYRGIKSLAAEINHRDWSFRKALVLELATTAALVSKYLDEAPITKRGRG